MPSTSMGDFLLSGEELDNAEANYIAHRTLAAASGRGDGESSEELHAEVRRTLALCYNMDVPGSDEMATAPDSLTASGSLSLMPRREQDLFNLHCLVAKHFHGIDVTNHDFLWDTGVSHKWPFNKDPSKAGVCPCFLRCHTIVSTMRTVDHRF